MKLKNICANCQEVTFTDCGGYTEVIYSYGIPVLSWRGNQYHRLWNGWSATTARHINKAIGRTMTKKEWLSMPVEVPSEFEPLEA